MSANEKRIERSQRFKRAWRGENRKKAVSPVVATLILILIAVAAAAALYLWLVAWQGGVTGGIGSPSAQYTVTIGGSTSIYPFDQVAVSYFEGNNSDVVVSDNEGGTGAGMQAVCSGQVDIGTASTLETVTGLESSDGCPATTVIQTVAYDAVDVIVPVANPHGLVSVSYDTLTAIYDGATLYAGGKSTGNPAATLEASSIDGVQLSTLVGNGATFAAIPTGGTTYQINTGLQWEQIPAAVSGATLGSYSESTSGNWTETGLTEGSTGVALTTTSAPVGTDTLSGTLSFTYNTADGLINLATVTPSGTVSGLADTDFACTTPGDCTWGTPAYQDSAASVSGDTVSIPFTEKVTVVTATQTASYTGAADAGSLAYGAYQTPIGITFGAATGTCPAAYPDDLCAENSATATPSAITSPCGFEVCAGGSTSPSAPATDYIVTYARSDASGTTQAFEARLLGAATSSSFATSFAGLGFSGCGSNNLLSDCGIVAAKTAVGNPGVISGVAGNVDAIGYASDGLTRVSTSGVSCEGVSSSACGIGFESPGQSAAIQPSLGATGTIAGGVINGGYGPSGATTTLSDAQSYAGTRPLQYVTTSTPTGEVERFIQYVLDPANNQEISLVSAEVSIYSV